MTTDSLVKARKEIKKAMFGYIKNSEEYNMLHDMSDKLKKLINALYEEEINNE